jgi:hypothetical protein
MDGWPGPWSEPRSFRGRVSLSRRSAPAAPTSRSAINYGSRARLGVIIPSGNTVVEPQFAAMLPPGVSLHVTRLRMRGGEAALSMLEELEDAALLLADAGVDRIIFHCTSVSMWSSEIALFIERRIRAVTNIPLTQTSGAVLQALHSVASATRIVLVSPYLRRYASARMPVSRNKRNRDPSRSRARPCATADERSRTRPLGARSRRAAGSVGRGLLSELYGDSIRGNHRVTRASGSYRQLGRDVGRAPRERDPRRGAGFRPFAADVSEAPC